MKLLNILKSIVNFDIKSGIVTLIIIGILAVLITGEITSIIPIIIIIIILFVIRKFLSRS